MFSSLPVHFYSQIARKVHSLCLTWSCPKSRGSKCNGMSSKKIIICLHVKFVETEFPITPLTKMTILFWILIPFLITCTTKAILLQIWRTKLTILSVLGLWRQQTHLNPLTPLLPILSHCTLLTSSLVRPLLFVCELGHSTSKPIIPPQIGLQPFPHRCQVLPLIP